MGEGVIHQIPSFWAAWNTLSKSLLFYCVLIQSKSAGLAECNFPIAITPEIKHMSDVKTNTINARSTVI